MQPRRRHILRWSAIGCLAVASAVRDADGAQAPAPGAPSQTDEPISISAADCTVEKLGSDDADRDDRRAGAAGHAVGADLDGRDRERARPIAASTVSSSRSTRAPPRGRSTSAWRCPRSWNRRAVQMGGGGMNGTVPGPDRRRRPGSPSLLARGIVTYGSDSGHQAGFGFPGARGGAGRPAERPAGRAAARLRVPADCLPHERTGRRRSGPGRSRRRAPSSAGSCRRRRTSRRSASRWRRSGPPMTGRSTTRRWPTWATCR